MMNGRSLEATTISTKKKCLFKKTKGDGLLIQPFTQTMSRDKQTEIDEMAIIIDDNHGFIVSSVETAKALYNAGYRKASDVAREIFAEIEKLRCTFTYPYLGANGTIFNKTDFNFHMRIEDYNELKKKYIVEGTNVTTNTEDGK